MTNKQIGDTIWTPVVFTLWWVALVCLAVGLGLIGYGLFVAANQSILLAH